MKLPFLIDKYYNTALSFKQIEDEINSLDTEKKLGGLRKDYYSTSISETGFIIHKSSSGADFFTIERFPVIEGRYFGNNPTILNIIIKPNYWIILFFSFFVFIFLSGAIFSGTMTINGVAKTPNIIERLIFGGIGGVIPGLWCYFGYIRPIVKAKKWIIKKLDLYE